MVLKCSKTVSLWGKEVVPKEKPILNGYVSSRKTRNLGNCWHSRFGYSVSESPKVVLGNA